MSEVSNKMLVGLLVVAIVVSLVGTFVSLNKIGKIGISGAQVTQGTLDFTLQSAAVVNVTTTTVNFGNVKVGGGNLSCTLDSETGGDGTCDPAGTDGTSANGGFVFENIGNVDINVSVQSGKLAAGLIGGNQDGGPAYKWKCRTKSGTGTAIISSFTDVTNASASLCYANMDESSSPGEDTAYLDIQLKIPSDATPGSKQDTITFSAVQSS